MKYLISLIVGSLVLPFTVLHAHEAQVGNIQIQHPWAKTSRPGQVSGGGFFAELKNVGSEDDRLVSAQSTIAERTELHHMKMEGEVMKMYAVPYIDLPAGQVVEVAPKKHHIMFINLKKPLVKGDKFPVELRFEKAGPLTVEFIVQDHL